MGLKLYTLPGWRRKSPILLLNSEVCERHVGTKALDYRNGSGTVGYGNICVCSYSPLSFNVVSVLLCSM